MCFLDDLSPHLLPIVSLVYQCWTGSLHPQNQITPVYGKLSALKAGWLWGVHIFCPFCVRVLYCLIRAGWKWHWCADSLPRKTLGVSGSGRVSQRTALFLLVSLELAGNRLTFTQSSAFCIRCSISGRSTRLTAGLCWYVHSAHAASLSEHGWCVLFF